MSFFIDPIANFFNTITSTFKSFLDYLSSIAGSIADFFVNLPSLVQQAFQWFLDQMINFVKYVWNSMVWVFNQVYDMIVNSMTTVINSIQCGLTEIYRKVKERLPLLLMYNGALLYIRRIINKGRPRDFLKIIPMAFVAGLGGFVISSLMPDIPQDRCIQITPFPVSTVTQALQPLQPVGVAKVQAFVSTVNITDTFPLGGKAPGKAPTEFSDTLSIDDSFSMSGGAPSGAPTTYSDSLNIGDGFGINATQSPLVSDRLELQDLLRTEIKSLTSYTDYISLSDSLLKYKLAE